MLDTPYEQIIYHGILNLKTLIIMSVLTQPIPVQQIGLNWETRYYGDIENFW